MIPILWSGNPCEAVTGTVRPSSDVNTTDWFSTPLWQKLDDNSDADSVFSSDFTGSCPTRNDYDFECHIANISGTPGVGSCQGIRVRYRIRRSEDVGSGQCDFTVQLKQGTTVKAQTVSTPGTTYTTYTLTLSIAQVDSITDHTDLRIRINASGCEDAFENGVYAECAWMEIEYYFR